MSCLLAGLGVLGHDEAEAGRVGLQPADDEVHLLRQAEAVAADLQQLAVGDERLQLALERGALLARHAEHLRELARGGGVMHLFPDADEGCRCGTSSTGMSFPNQDRPRRCRGHRIPLEGTW